MLPLRSPQQAHWGSSSSFFPHSYYLFIFLPIPPLTGVDGPLDLDILFWGGNFASYLTFSIFPRPSSRLDCCSMFCNYVIRPPLRFIVTFLYRSLVREVINVSRLMLTLRERYPSTVILWFRDRIRNSFSVLQIRRVDNWILCYVLSGKISTSTAIVMVPPLLSSSAPLFSLSLTSLPWLSWCVYAAFFFHIMRARALH